MKSKLIRCVLFLFILAFLFIQAQKIFDVNNATSRHGKGMMNGYYAEAENTVDAVFVGNSHIYRYWQPAFGWGEYGIATQDFSIADMPFSVMKNAAIEAQKTQSPKVIVFDALAFADEDSQVNNKIYYVLTAVKKSDNYYDMLDNYFRAAGVKGLDKIAYYFPMIQFHSEWKTLDESLEKNPPENILNSLHSSEFKKKRITKKQAVHYETQTRAAIGEVEEQFLRELLEWCDEQKDIQIEFVAMPVLKSEKRMGQINTVGDIVKSYGYSFTNFNDANWYNKCQFKETSDFMDTNHTGVKGSYKICRLYGKYLMQKYNLPDRRGQAGYESWDERTKQYYDEMSSYLPDIE